MVKETSSSIKKKRKTGPTENEDTDIYKKVVDFEEKESSTRQSAADAAIFFELCQDIRETMKEVLYQKSQSTADAGKNKIVYKELQTDLFLKLCVIKKLNRIDKIKHVFGKDSLSVEKQKCDSIKLSYQNLVYELHHLVAETNKCSAFKSKDEDIELVSFEEFMKEAPEASTNKFIENDENDREQQHSLRLARLEWELTQRKNLAHMCKELEEEQKKIEQDLVVRKEKLDALRPLLMNVINSTKPLQEHLDININDFRKEHEIAALLPDPLYIFYVNVVSYKNVYKINLNVSILGDKDQATRWKEAMDMENESLDNEEDSDADVDIPEIEEVVEVKKRRHRKSVQQVDPMEEKKRKMLEAHPLSVEVTAILDNGLSIKMQFQYQTKLKIITVTSSVDIPSNITGSSARDILSGESILGELIEGDTGTDSPNPMTHYQLKKIGISSYQTLIPQIGYAYHWAQRVCGIDFVTKEINSDKMGSTNIESNVKLLFRCLRARYDLALQLQQLEQNIIPKLPATVDAPSNTTACLSKWLSITYQKFCQHTATQMLLEEDVVSPADLFYSVTITRENASLLAYIVIRNNYPETTPIFCLCLTVNGQSYHALNSDEIRDMERSLNTEWAHDDSSSPWLLSAQITYLCSLMDVYLESMDNKTFSQKVTFIKSHCARNRRRPFKFRKMGTGIFTQY